MDRADTDPTPAVGDEDEARAEPESRQTWKLQRLTGPQACLAILGCGTLAAVVVVLVVVGAMRLITGAFTSGDSGESAGEPTPQRSPRETYDPDAISRICELMESQSQLRVNDQARSEPDQGWFNFDFVESHHEPLSDACAWEVPSNSGGDLDFNLAYLVVARSSPEYSMSEMAVMVYEEHVNGGVLGAAHLDGPEEVVGLGNEAHYFYSADGVEGSRSNYLLISRSQNVIVMLKLDDVTGQEGAVVEPLTEEEFLRESRQAVEYVQEVLNALSPDDSN